MTKIISAADLMRRRIEDAKKANQKSFVIPKVKTTWTEKTAPVRIGPYIPDAND